MIIEGFSKGIDALVESMVERLFVLFEDQIINSRIDMMNFFRTYLNHASEAHGQIKTLAHAEPQDFKVLYEDLYIKSLSAKCNFRTVQDIDEEEGTEVFNTSDVNRIFEIGRKILITGYAGTGKTMILNHFLLSCVEEHIGVPVFLNLRRFNIKSDLSLPKLLYEATAKLDLKIGEKYFEFCLIAGKFIFLLDGFDEIQSSIKDKVEDEIKDMSTKYGKNYYVVTSRPQACFRSWDSFYELRVSDLNKEQAISIVNRLIIEEEIKEKFCNQLDEYFDSRSYHYIASNPLMLMVMIKIFERYGHVPPKNPEFFQTAFSVLFQEHDASKGGFHREITSKLTFTDFVKVFSYICLKLILDDSNIYTSQNLLALIKRAQEKRIIDVNFISEDYLKDLSDAVSVLVFEDMSYRFLHNSFKEYFAAQYTASCDDVKQLAILKDYLIKKDGMTDFIESLYALQKERFIKNVLYPGWCEIREIANHCIDVHHELLFSIYKSVNVPYRYKYGYKLNSKNWYLHFVVYFSCKTLKLSKIKKSVSKQREIAAELARSYSASRFDINFNILKQNGQFDQLDNTLTWLYDQFDFILAYLPLYELRLKKMHDSSIDKE
jgi:predicted NACHT family NTPase